MVNVRMKEKLSNGILVFEVEMDREELSYAAEYLAIENLDTAEDSDLERCMKAALEVGLG